MLSLVVIICAVLLSVRSVGAQNGTNSSTSYDKLQYVDQLIGSTAGGKNTNSYK